MYEYIAAYLFKAKIVEPEERFISREQHGDSTILGAFYAPCFRSNRDAQKKVVVAELPSSDAVAQLI
jgi:hypothetical protein